METKKFIAALLGSIVFGLLTAFFVFGFLKVLSLQNDGSIGYWAAVSGQVLISAVALFHLLRNSISFKNQLRAYNKAKLDKEVTKRAAEIIAEKNKEQE